jgi:hypothetical protein
MNPAAGSADEGDAVGGICALAGVLATTVGWYSVRATSMPRSEDRGPVADMDCLAGQLHKSGTLVLGLDPGTRSMPTKLSYVRSCPRTPGPRPSQEGPHNVLSPSPTSHSADRALKQTDPNTDDSLSLSLSGADCD